MFRPYGTTIKSYYKNRFIHFQYILESQIVYKVGMVVIMLCDSIYIKVKTDSKIDVCLFKKLC
jgi:hypothetical protein